MSGTIHLSYGKTLVEIIRILRTQDTKMAIKFIPKNFY